MIENANAQEAEQIEIQITEDVAETDVTGQQTAKNDGDELDEYTKTVSKRINKLNKKTRDAEQRAAYLEQVANQKDQELNQYRQLAVNQQATVLDKEEEALKSKEAQVEDIYQKAVASGDAELMSKATTLKTDVSIQKERLRTARNRQQAQPQAQTVAQPQQTAQQVAQEQTVQPSEQALSWHDKNKWFIASEEQAKEATEENMEATQFANFVHINLVQQGVEADSDEYYEELDKRIKKVYPNLVSSDSEGTAVETETQPNVQRVASAPSGGRRETRKSGVTFTKSEIQRLSGLKPHGMTDETWFQVLAKEKQKTLEREAR